LLPLVAVFKRSDIPSLRLRIFSGLREVIADEVPLAGAICAPEGEALNGTAGVRIVMLDRRAPCGSIAAGS
jgi:hypothetical protein